MKKHYQEPIIKNEGIEGEVEFDWQENTEQGI